MVANKKILIISNYPIIEPLHGGQKRVAAVVREYKKVFSNVKFVAIFMREHYKIYSKDDIYITGDWAERIRDNYLTSDIEIARAMLGCEDVRNKIEKLLRAFKPDIIQIEQVFPFIGLQKILKDLGLHPKLVYSSQNIEAPMRKEIMEQNGAGKKYIDESVSLISEHEIFLARNADLVAAVSRDNGEYLLSRGAKRYTLAPNGIYQSQPTKSAELYWKEYVKKRGISKIALFVGSGHFPNASSFKKMIGFRVGFIPPDSRIIIAGAVGDSVREIFDNNNVLDSPFWKRVVSVGVVKQELLDGLITKSDVLLLPIVEGGGSNLKTAEAIMSGKKIVATSFAFRGFDDYLKLPNIWIADTPEDFRLSIVKAFETRVKEWKPAELNLANQVQWEYSLKQLIKEVDKL